jgi:uncharacterized membrane protein
MISLYTFFVLIVVLAFTVASKIYQKIAVHKVNPVAFSILSNIFAALFLLPFVYNNLISYNPTLKGILIIFIGSVIWSFVGVISKLSIQKSDVSLREPILSLRIILIALLGVIFLNEQINIFDSIGILLIFLGILFSNWHGKKFDFGTEGFRWAMISVVTMSLAVFVDKIGSDIVGAEVYAFYIFLFSGLFRLFTAYKYKAEIIHIFTKESKIFFLNVFLLAYGFYGGIKVYSLLPISIAYPVLQFGSVLIVLSAIIFLGEKNNLRNRIIGSVVATLGVILFGIK